MASDKRLIFQGVPNLDFAFQGTFPVPYDKTKFTATMTTTNGHGSTFSGTQLFNGQAEIGRRGNTTAGFLKAAINAKLLNGQGKKLAVPLLGMPSGSGWSILAEYQDKTHMRTMFGHRLAYCLGQPWASRSIKVTVSHNAVPQGLFTLCEKVEDGTARIDITPGEEGDNPDTVDFVMEQLPLHQVDVDGGEKVYTDIRNKTWIAKVPDPDEITDEHLAYCGAKIDAFYAAVFAGDWALVDSLIDRRSFAQFYLLQDLLKNQDADHGSWYYTVKKGKLYAGPGWDWNGIWGPSKFADYTGMPTDFTVARDTYLDKKANYFALMLQNWPAFAEEVREVFMSSLPDIHQLFADLEAYVPQLVATGLIEQDRALWPDILQDATLIPLPSYEAEYERARTWIRDRLLYQVNAIYDYHAPQPAYVNAPA